MVADGAVLDRDEVVDVEGGEADYRAVMAGRLSAFAADLDGLPTELLEGRCYTASIYVDAAARSLRFAARTALSHQALPEEDDGIDPRLLEWIS